MMLKIGKKEYPSLRDKVSAEEWAVRVELAALFRLIPLMGWDDLSNQLCSARVGEHFLVGPNGLLFEEVTASSLIKINIEGEPVEDSAFDVVKSVWYPMRAVYEAREDAMCVIHTHDDYITAVAANSLGLLPVSQPAAFVLAAGLSYHTYEGVETYAERIPSLQEALGPHNHSLILRNHGLLTQGPNIEAAFMLHYMVRKACRVQVMAGSLPGGALIHLSDAMLESFRYELVRASQGDGSNTVWPGILRKLERMDASFKD